MPATKANPSVFSLALDGQLDLVPWTVEQYHLWIQNGWLPEDTGAELIDGFIVRKDRSAAGEDPMTIGDRHRLAVNELVDVAPAFKLFGCFLQIQQPVSMPPDGEPEPDASIARGRSRDYADGPPGPPDVLCVIEVSDSSLLRDTTVKLRIYAEAGTPVYVVVDLQHDVVLVHRDPNAGAGTYPPPQTLRRGDTLSLPTAGSDTVDIAVDQLL